MNVHKIILTLLILVGIATVGYLIYFGYDYYALTLTARPRAELHELLKPSGLYSHGYGIIGSLMLLLLFLYSVRKRVRWFPKIGKLSTWLKYHMFLGVMGPVLITFHTTFKFNGIVSISYWSMIIVMLSGIVGRYLYSKIPRTISGHEMALEDVQAENSEIAEKLREEYHVPATVMADVENLGSFAREEQSDLRALFRLILGDLKRPFILRRLYRELKTVEGLDKSEYKRVKRLTRQKVKITRKLTGLEVTHRLFHYWHVFHKPFAYVMIFIMFIHITVTVLFGYTWIF